MRRVSSFVLTFLGHLDQFVDGVQQVVAVLPQQLLVEPLVLKAHLQQHGHHGRVLPGGGVDPSLQKDRKKKGGEGSGKKGGEKLR